MKTHRVSLLVLIFGLAPLPAAHSEMLLTPYLLVQHRDEGSDLCTNPPLPEGTIADRSIFVSHERQAWLLEINRLTGTARLRSASLSADVVRALKRSAHDSRTFRLADCQLPMTVNACLSTRGEYRMVWYSRQGFVNEFRARYVPEPNPAQACPAELTDVLISIFDIRDYLAQSGTAVD